MNKDTEFKQTAAIANWVPAARQNVIRIDANNIQRMAETAMQPVTTGEIDANALRSVQAVSEKSTPVNRAQATILKAAAALVGTAIISWAMTKAGVDSGISWGIFGTMFLGAISWLYRSDNAFSPLGVERYKATEYRKIRHAEIASNERVQLAKLDAYMKTLERVTNHDND